MVCLLYYTIVISNVHSILGLASKKKKCQVPFSRIAKNQSEFIESKYIPRRMTLNDPRAMKREEIIQFFKHIETRQVSHGIQDAFRFRATLSSRKKGSLRKQEYSEENLSDPASIRNPAPWRRNTPRDPPTEQEDNTAIDNPAIDTVDAPDLPSATRKKRRSKKNKKNARGVPAPNPASNPAHDPAPEPSTQDNNAIPNGFMFNSFNAGPLLTLDVGHSFDIRIPLDKSLDPDFDSFMDPSANNQLFTPDRSPSTSNRLFTPPPTQIPPTWASNPLLSASQPESAPRRSERQRGKNAA